MSETTEGKERTWWEVKANGRTYATDFLEDAEHFMANPTVQREWTDAELWKCHERTEIVRSLVKANKEAT